MDLLKYLPPTKKWNQNAVKKQWLGQGQALRMGLKLALALSIVASVCFMPVFLLEANSLVDPSDLRNTSSLELAQDYFQLSL